MKRRNDLLAAQFDGNPLIEWVELMQDGFWGEGHTRHTNVGVQCVLTGEGVFPWQDLMQALKQLQYDGLSH